jgi:hypothetical protein
MTEDKYLDLIGQFSDHRGQISVFSNDKFVGDMGYGLHIGKTVGKFLC